MALLPVNMVGDNSLNVELYSSGDLWESWEQTNIGQEK
jgi:hypothetical protein